MNNINMQHQNGYTLFELIYVLVIIVGGIGWILNIVDIVSMTSEPITGMFILRCVGVLCFPLGAVLGYF